MKKTDVTNATETTLEKNIKRQYNCTVNPCLTVPSV